jgi:hypothetical protein
MMSPREVAAQAMLDHWHQIAAKQEHNSPEGHIAALLDAVEAAGVRFAVESEQAR